MDLQEFGRIGEVGRPAVEEHQAHHVGGRHAAVGVGAQIDGHREPQPISRAPRMPFRPPISQREKQVAAQKIVGRYAQRGGSLDVCGRLLLIELDGQSGRVIGRERRVGRQRLVGHDRAGASKEKLDDAEDAHGLLSASAQSLPLVSPNVARERSCSSSSRRSALASWPGALERRPRARRERKGSHPDHRHTRGALVRACRSGRPLRGPTGELHAPFGCRWAARADNFRRPASRASGRSSPRRTPLPTRAFPGSPSPPLATADAAPMRFVRLVRVRLDRRGPRTAAARRCSSDRRVGRRGAGTPRTAPAPAATPWERPEKVGAKQAHNRNKRLFASTPKKPDA